jgi:folylpolyglutamate synthase/dihydropteroate synthase
MPKKSYKAQDIAAACDAIGFNSYEVMTDAEAALARLRTYEQGPLIITGSLYLVSQLRADVIQLSHA